MLFGFSPSASEAVVLLVCYAQPPYRAQAVSETRRGERDIKLRIVEDYSFRVLERVPKKAQWRSPRDAVGPEGKLSTQNGIMITENGLARRNIEKTRIG